MIQTIAQEQNIDPRRSAYAPQPQSRLLNLSPELRNEIYTYALTAKAPVEISSNHKPCEPPMLSTCHQIRHEATGIFYSATPFRQTIRLESKAITEAAEQPFLPVWLRHIGREKAKMIEHGVCALSCSDYQWKLLKGCERICGAEWVERSFRGAFSKWVLFPAAERGLSLDAVEIESWGCGKDECGIRKAENYHRCMVEALIEARGDVLWDIKYLWEDDC